MADPEKNVVVISVDDMIDVVRFGESLGVDIQTPALDRLMSMGVTFENAFTPVPICSPARTATMGGKRTFAAHRSMTAMRRRGLCKLAPNGYVRARLLKGDRCPSFVAFLSLDPTKSI